jgi:mono/diheme cytochrome c family protein
MKWVAHLFLAWSLASGGLVASTNLSSQPRPFQVVLPDDSLWPQGRFVYQQHCLVCHGRFGDGRGEMSRDLMPPPRNFGRGVFKYRSTPAGALPTDADLERTIRGGLAGTAMPMFTQLSPREVKSVIEYVKSFSSSWRNPTNYAPPIELPAMPSWFDNAPMVKRKAEEGRRLFNASCVPCHGADGSGQGASAMELRDVWDQPVTVTDLRQPVLRSGRDLQAVYRVLITGIEGTPMPSFAEALTDQERWSLIALISELRKTYAEDSQ